MDKVLEKIKEEALRILAKKGLALYKIEKAKEYGMLIYRVLIEEEGKAFNAPSSIEVDTTEEILNELLDCINDDLPDGAYLEVATSGLERTLQDDDLPRAIDCYIHISMYEKVLIGKNSFKELEGTLKEVNADEIVMEVKNKNKKETINIKKSNLASIRLAVEF